MSDEKLPLCHVCNKPKKPYTVYIKNDLFSLMNHVKKYDKAREDGEICERCYSYFCMTGILKEPTEEEFNKARATSKRKHEQSKKHKQDEV